MSTDKQPFLDAWIDEAMIERLVRLFYGRARLDPLIGPIFEAKVHDWEAHIGQICDFWSSVMLKSGRYRGQPMVAHMLLPVGTPHFERWLEIFTETAREIFPPAAATQFVERAYRIAESLELGIAAQKEQVEPVPKRNRPAEPDIELSSPACSMREADAAYMGYADKEELAAFLKDLLEAEQRGNARWCAMLSRQIEAIGAMPPPTTTVIADVGGQAWVVRRLREILPRVRDDALYADLTEMLHSYEAEILAEGAANRAP
jgi:hemoglobin